MGQSESSEDAHLAKIQQHLGVIKKAATLTYKEFLDSVTEVNNITHSFTDRHGKQLLFAIKPGTDETFLWKGTIRIKCLKVNTQTNRVESSRVLNLRQYIMLYQEITEQVKTGLLQQTQQGTTSISVILQGVDNLMMQSAEQEECCICMDNKSEVILACEHRFCERCIDAWNVTHHTCPICRAHVKSADDTWVLTEKPDKEEYASEVKHYLMGLADRTGAPQ